MLLYWPRPNTFAQHRALPRTLTMFGVAQHRNELLRLWDVKTGIDIPEFRRLSVGCIHSERDYVLNGLEFGFPLGVNPAGPFPPPRLWAES